MRALVSQQVYRIRKTFLPYLDLLPGNLLLALGLDVMVSTLVSSVGDPFRRKSTDHVEISILKS